MQFLPTLPFVKIKLHTRAFNFDSFFLACQYFIFIFEVLFIMKKSLLAIALMSTLLVACNKHENKTEITSDASTPVQTAQTNNNEAVDTAHTAENSLDWDGKYKGTLPCADCEGIKTELELKDDKTYELTETYLGKGDANPFETHGKFTFDKDNTSVITLDDKAQNRKFFIGENTATALDMEGKKVEGSLAEHYVLKKEN